MKDLIRLSGLSFYGYHGVSAAEKETGRVFEVDCELETDIAQAGRSDQLSDTVDYGAVYSLVKEVVTGRAYALVEALAAELANQILDKFPIYRVTLRVRKINPPVDGVIKHIEIEVTRSQTDESKLVDRSGT